MEAKVPPLIMLLNTPDLAHGSPELPPADETGRALQILSAELASGGHRLISLTHTAEECREMLTQCRRFYLDLDGTMLKSGATTFDADTLDTLRLLLDNGAAATFITGKPESEIARLMRNLPGDLQGSIGVLYEKGAYMFVSQEEAAQRILATPALESAMEDLRTECRDIWTSQILRDHGVRLVPAGDGSHRCILSIDLFRPDATVAPQDSDRQSAKIQDPQVIAAAFATLSGLLHGTSRPLDLTLTDLGNGNFEIQPREIDKGIALTALEQSQSGNGRALVVGDSGNDESMFKAARALQHASTALVYHERTPHHLAVLADIAITGHANGRRILHSALEADGITDSLIVVSNTASLQRVNGGNGINGSKSEFINRMGAPLAIGNVVAGVRNAFWIFPSEKRDNFRDYPDSRINRKFRPVLISKEEKNSQYDRISNGVWWFWAHPHAFPAVEQYPDADWQNFRNVSVKAAHELNDSLLTDDLTYVSVHDFQVSPTAREFHSRFNRENIRFHMFWHIPFPSPQQAFNRGLPVERIVEFLRDLAMHDVIGFHTQQYADNYLALCTALYEHGVKPARTCVIPISVDVDDISRRAQEIAQAKDFEFSMPELNRIFQTDLPEEKRERVIAGPAERADPIKGGLQRNLTRLAIARENPQLLEGKRFLEVLLPSRMDNSTYADNYRELVKTVDMTNRALGRTAVFTVERIENRNDLYAKLLGSDEEYNSLDEGFGMTIAEKLVVASATRHLPGARKHQVYAPANMGFMLSLQEHGIGHAVPSYDVQQDPSSQRRMQESLYRSELPEPDYTALDAYFAQHTLHGWMQSLVRNHVSTVFDRGIVVAR